MNYFNLIINQFDLFQVVQCLDRIERRHFVSVVTALDLQPATFDLEPEPGRKGHPSVNN